MKNHTKPELVNVTVMNSHNGNSMELELKRHATVKQVILIAQEKGLIKSNGELVLSEENTAKEIKDVDDLFKIARQSGNLIIHSKIHVGG